MKYNVRLKTANENGVFEMEVEEMICNTCRYSHIRKGIEGIVYDSYQCWGEKEAPTISPYDSCEYWKSKNVKANT